MSYSSQIKTAFSGPSSSTTPPHNGLAVGSKYVVMVEGSRIEWTDLTGGSPTVESTYSFFASLSPTGGLYDQRCYWDPVNQRYIVIMQYESSVAGEIDIAISKDSNPNDGWYFAQLNTSLTINGQVTGSDRPMLAIDGSNIYITAAEYNVNGGYVGTECWTIGDTAGAGGGVYNGGTLTVTASELTPSSQGIYAVAAGNNGTTYYASDYSNGSQIVAALQTYNVATNTFGPTATVALGNIDQGATYTAQQMGTSLLLDAGDRRIASMAYANGFLYAVAVMEAPGASVPSVHWFKINVSNPNAPNLVAQGDISGAAIGTNVATFNPSIAVDASGDVIINFTASGPNMYPADYYVFQGGHDPTGVFSAPILYQASTGYFNSGNGSTVQRWGVNSSATVDPNNPNSFWISNEYVASGWWQTSVAQVAIQNPAITMVSSIVTSGAGVTSGSGDLNAGHPVTLTVNFTGTVTVNTAGGAPTLTLNDGGTATYSGGSGSTALTFSYTVAAGQSTPDLGISAFNLTGAIMTDGAGNTADVSGAINLNPAGTLVIDTTAPVPAFSQEPSSTTGSTTAVFAFTTSNSETGGVSYAYELDGATTWTPVNGNTLSLSGLAVGSHVIQLKATDGAGNVSASPASYSWTITPPAAQIKTQFSAISLTGTYPPNNALAVGPNYVVMMEASRIEWTNLTGGSPVLQSVYSFFSPLGSSADNSLNHPRAIYDSVNQRYIMIMDNNASGHTISTIDIAVSKDTNPNDGWYLAALNTSVTINGQLTAADSPTIAVDGTNIYITATQYNVNVSGTAGTEDWVIGDTAGTGGGIYNGGTLTVVANEVLPASEGTVTVAAGNNGSAYYASDYSSGGQMVVTLQTYNATTNTFGATSTIGLGNIDQGGSYTAQQLGTSLLLNAGDNRARSLVYANGFLYGVAEMEAPGSSVPEVHWFKINVSNPNAPTLVAQGDISGAAIGTNVATFNGSIAVDASGDVLINFVASGPNMYPADYYVYQKGSDPPGTFSAPILYQASTGFFNSGASGVQPWGNYSTATVDPNNPNSFWISNEYVANNWWQTSVAQIAFVTAPTLTSIVPSGAGITSGSGDLNAGHVVTLTVNFSTAVTVNTTGGSPTLSLNDGATATYTGGAGSTALTFSYTVAAGQNTPDLVVSSFNLNGATVTDGAGNVVNLSGATNYNPAGTLQINTTAPAVSSIVASGAGITGGSGDLDAGNVVTLTVSFSTAVTVNTTGGTPTLTLNDGASASYAGGSGTAALVFSYTVAAGQNTPDLVVSAFNLNGATVKDAAGNTADLSGATNDNPAGTLQIDTVVPTVASIVTTGPGITNGSGNLGTGQVVTLTVNCSEPVTVNTTGGSPTLGLNDGGTATYTGGSGTAALTFSYTVAAGQNTPDLVVSSFNLNGASVTDGAGNPANLSDATNYNPAGTLQINTTASAVSSIMASGAGITGGSGDLNAGHVVTLTVNFSTAVTVNTTGGSPTLSLNDGATATYTGGSGTAALTFSYTVAAGQNTPDLAVSAFNLNGATVKDAAGNTADLSGATGYNPVGTLQIDTVAPTIASIVTSGPGITNGSGNLGTGQVVTLTVNLSTAVTVNTTGGSPTLSLNDGGTATYTGGSGSAALTFSYTVAAGQNTPDLAVSAFNLNGATVTDGAGNVAEPSGANNYNPTGTLQISTTAVTVSSIVPLGSGITSGSGDFNAGHVVTLTVNFSTAVTVNTTGGSPTLSLNDGATATYTGGSGSTALTFSYTVAAGQNTPDLVVSSFNLNGATVTDGAGNVANLSGATNYNPAGTLQIDTVAPVPAFSQEPPSVTNSGTAAFAFTTTNSETGGISYAYELDGATTWTPVSGNTLSLSGLANGSHVIQLQATDGAGNVSGSPASYNWTIAPAAAQIETQFSGISVTSTYPPNNGLAAGPNSIVMMEGSRIEWTNLAGGSPTLQSVYSFFSPLGATAANSLNHPRCVYDSINQRYIVIMDNSASGHTISNIDIAVSKDSNPADGWYFASLNTSITINGQLTAADSPTLSVDGTNIYITAAQYNVNISGSPGTECWVIGDTAGSGGGIYNGGTLTVVANQLTPSTQSIFTATAGNNGRTYYASDYSNGSQIVVALQTYDAATNTFGPASIVGLGNIDQGGAYTAQQLGTSLLLDAGDKRARSLAYANGFLYGVAELKPIGSSVPEVHWFKIDVSNPNAPTLVAQGDISGAAIGTNVATFNPSIAVDASGDVIINFTASGPNMYPGDYYVYQKSGDPAGSFSAPILYQASTGFFNSGNGSSVQPWGNYSTATVDPNNPNSFWVSNQYVASGWWQTSVAQVAIETAEPPTLTITNASLNVTAGGSVALGITATPVDSDDQISVKISGVPTYETVTAPSGDTVTSNLQGDGTNTWTITEGASTTGKPLTGLTLISQYTGTGHPIATLAVTASNTSSGETATSASQTIAVTDPPATTSGRSRPAALAASNQGPGQVDRLVALMDQFAAAGFHSDPPGIGAIAWVPHARGSEDVTSLATPHHHGA